MVTSNHFTWKTRRCRWDFWTRYALSLVTTAHCFSLLSPRDLFFISCCVPGTTVSMHSQSPPDPVQPTEVVSVTPRPPGPFQRKRSRSERLSDFCRVCEVVRRRGWLQTQVCVTPRPVVRTATSRGCPKQHLTLLKAFCGPSLNCWSPSVYSVHSVWTSIKKGRIPPWAVRRSHGDVPILSASSSPWPRGLLSKSLLWFVQAKVCGCLLPCGVHFSLVEVLCEWNRDNFFLSLRTQEAANGH